MEMKNKIKNIIVIIINGYKNILNFFKKYVDIIIICV